MRFRKPALSIPDQIKLLKCRGMTVEDEDRAQHYLRFLSYYRLEAYWLPFEVPPADDGGHAFRDGTNFNDVLALYDFDRKLRLLVSDAIERVEIALRAQWAYHMAIEHGPHGYLEQSHYKFSDKEYKECRSRLEREFMRSRETFIESYRRKYTSPEFPPVWMAVEVMSFGLLSKFYENLKRRKDRQAIARPFGKLDETVIVAFAHHISYVRNICAHHGRLWNRRLTIKMIVPKSHAGLRSAMNDADTYAVSYLYNTLVMLDHLLTIITPDNKWKDRIVDLIEGCPLVDPVGMGFPEGWRTHPAWRISAAARG